MVKAALSSMRKAPPSPPWRGHKSFRSHQTAANGRRLIAWYLVPVLLTPIHPNRSEIDVGSKILMFDNRRNFMARTAARSMKRRFGLRPQRGDRENKHWLECYRGASSPKRRYHQSSGVNHCVAFEESAVLVPMSQDEASHRPVNRRRFFAKT